MKKQNLMEEYRVAMDKTNIFVNAFPWQEKEKYIGWLSQTYYFVRHSTRLLALAGAHAPFGQQSLHQRMVQHIREEMGHEILAVNDIKALGGNIQEIAELPETKAFVQNQYFYIQNRSSCAFMGYILFLEGLSSQKGPMILSLAREAFPSNAINFIRIHAEEDQEHIQSAFEAMESVPADQLEAVIDNMHLSCDLYERMLKSVKDKVPYLNLPSKDLGLNFPLNAKYSRRATV
mgnify:CR=1 FL=1